MIVAIAEYLLFSNKKVISYLNHHPILIWPFEKLKKNHISILKISIIFSLVGLIWFDVFIRVLRYYSYSFYNNVNLLVSKFHSPTLLNFSQNYTIIIFGIILIVFGLGFFIFPIIVLSGIVKKELKRPKVKV